MGIVGIALEKFNPSDGIICFVSLQNVATHCIGYKKGDILDGFTIPCGWGNLDDNVIGEMLSAIGYGFPIGVTPINLSP